MLQPKHYRERRHQFLKRLGDHQVAVVASSPPRTRNKDVEYAYRQDSDFHYLTGFDEPSAVAVFVPGRDEGEYVLFCREFDPEMAIWTGRHAGLEGARAEYGADQALPITSLAEKLPDLLANRKAIHYAIGLDAELDQQIMAALNQARKRGRAGVEAPSQLIHIDQILHEMRLIKTSAELAVMRRAAEISIAAHQRAMRAAHPGRYEYEIEAEFLHELNRQGIRSPAYSSIVAGGANACVLHYIENSAPLREGDLLLIDAGAEVDHYAADITRTFPVSGTFTEPQRILYEWVLAAQMAAIKQIKPGNRWIDPHDAAVRVLTKGLISLGLLQGKLPRSIKDETYKKFYMHRTGHWLGMDVHDVGAYKQDGHWRTFEPGMVLTVEPGLYIAPDCEDVDPKWRGIGIRIEDDVLVTRKGNEVLTAALPKTVEAIENFLAGA